MTTSKAQHPEVVATGKLWQAAVLAAVLAVIGNLIVFFVGNQLLPTPLLIPTQPGGTELAPLTALPVIAATIIPILLAALFLTLLGRWVARPFTIFTVVAVLFLLLSFISPLLLPVDLMSKLILNAMHVVAGVIAIGVLTTRGRAK